MRELNTLRGNESAKRACEVAITGHHPVVIIANDNMPDARIFARWLGGHGIHAAMLLPCPCGNLGSTFHSCSCTVSEIRTHVRSSAWASAHEYAVMRIEVVAVSLHHLTSTRKGEDDQTIMERVQAAQTFDSDHQDMRILPETLSLVNTACKRFNITSCVEYDSLLAVARSIACLDGKDSIGPIHYAEAVQYRVRQNNPVFTDTTEIDTLAELKLLREAVERIAATLEESNA